MKQRVCVAPLICAVLVMVADSALSAELRSDDGNTYLTNQEGVVTLIVGEEQRALQPVLRLAHQGDLVKARDACDEMLASAPGNRWIRLGRMWLSAKLGDTDKSEQDFNELTNRFPNFLAPYQSRLNILSDQPVATGEKPVLIKWLSSAGEHEKNAAREEVEARATWLRYNAVSWLTSADEQKQKSMLGIIQAVHNAATNSVVFPSAPGDANGR